MSHKNTTTRIRWIPFPRTERAEELYNPYRGLYTIFRFYADNEYIQPGEQVIEDVPMINNQQLCLIEINLINFNDKPIEEHGFLIIRRIFNHFSNHGKQMIVRFLYDWEGKSILTEPKDIEIILEHMSQLSPILKEYSETIYILQGLFIGSWGEMHSSRYISDRHMSRLAKRIYECSGASTQIALRCPSFWRMMFKTHQPLDKTTAFIDIQKARFSLFNDGMMASISDYGTYGSISAIESKDYGDKWIRDDELEFQNKLCQYVSNGGEVINQCDYNDVAPAIDNLSRMRISYLHSDYDEQVLNKWKKAKSDFGKSIWKDKTAFEYIVAHLGYRFTIEEVEMTTISDKNGDIKVTIGIVNRGFAPCYHRFDVKIIVRTTSYTEFYEYPIDTDTRFWMPDEKVELDTIISSTDWKHTNYVIGLSIFDPRTKQTIEIANTFSKPDYRGIYSLGNFIINT